MRRTAADTDRSDEPDTRRQADGGAVAEHRHRPPQVRRPAVGIARPLSPLQHIEEYSS
jgi:hypothetical protein